MYVIHRNVHRNKKYHAVRTVFIYSYKFNSIVIITNMHSKNKKIDFYQEIKTSNAEHAAPLGLREVNYCDNLIRDFRRRTLFNISSKCIFGRHNGEKNTHPWTDRHLINIFIKKFTITTRITRSQTRETH